MSDKTSLTHLIVTKAFYYLRELAEISAATVIAYFGYQLYVRGVPGQASAVLQTVGFKGYLVDAGPGLFFGIGGIVILALKAWAEVERARAAKKPGADRVSFDAVPLKDLIT